MTQEKRSGTVLLIVGAIILIPIILINFIMIIKTYTDPDHLPGVLGFKPVVVLSSSMSPEFESGAVIFIKEKDANDLAVGDIICYLAGGTAITHRISQIIDNDSGKRYITKGDAKNTIDQIAVAPEQVEGVYIGKLPGVGSFLIFLQSPMGIIIFIAIPLIGYILYNIIKRKKVVKGDSENILKLDTEVKEIVAENEKIKKSYNISEVTDIDEQAYVDKNTEDK